MKMILNTVFIVAMEKIIRIVLRLHANILHTKEVKGAFIIVWKFHMDIASNMGVKKNLSKKMYAQLLNHEVWKNVEGICTQERS